VRKREGIDQKVWNRRREVEGVMKERERERRGKMEEGSEEGERERE
jgi:hypothetical protein